MDVETAIQAFASAGHDPPRDAMQWALDHWDEVAPGLLNLLEHFASGADRSNDTASTVFFILHLAGEKQDTRVFPLLCRLAQDGEALEAALGDDITPTLKRLLVRTYDGDLDTLTGLIEAVEAEGDIRAAALAVLSNLTATGRIAREKAEAYVREAVSGAVRQAFGRGLADPKLSGPSAFSNAANREQEQHAIGRQDVRRTAPDTSQSFTAPLKTIGRNDPCPCGSGKKFKKCCLQ
ncbi:MAG: DUF1186 domain-containing protein [Xanthobacteraceae bacterium]